MPTDAVCQASLKSSSFLKPLSHTQAHNCSAGPLIKRSLHTKNPAVSIPARFSDTVGQRAGVLQATAEMLCRMENIIRNNAHVIAVCFAIL